MAPRRGRADTAATMIGYTTIGTNDLARATAFYDALFAEFGAKRLMEFPQGIFWGTGFDKPMFGVLTPHDGNKACLGNGSMVALAGSDPAMVQRVYAKALELGGTDEGPPGPRGEQGFYAGYFRDPEGNKLNCFCMGAG